MHGGRQRALGSHIGASRLGLVLLALAIAAAFLACTTNNDGTPTTARTDGTPVAQDGVPTGLWGGDGIILRVTETVSTVEYECAAGTITEPLRVDAAGRFEASGWHANVTGGPIEPTPQTKSLRAFYTGRVDGSRMEITVILTKTGDEVGQFELAYGQEPHLERCL